MALIGSVATAVTIVFEVCRDRQAIAVHSVGRVSNLLLGGLEGDGLNVVTSATVGTRLASHRLWKELRCLVAGGIGVDIRNLFLQVFDLSGLLFICFG